MIEKEFKRLSTNNKSKGVNTKQFIIVHHTASKEGSIKGILNILTKGDVSVHYTVDVNGDVYKIGEDSDILWHAGISEWGKLKGMNFYSIGIEVVGPSSDGGFPFAQRSKVKELIQYLMKLYGIPQENVLRHADLTNTGSSKKILWDGKSKSRKIDIAPTFFNNKYKDWEDYQNSLICNYKE